MGKKPFDYKQARRIIDARAKRVGDFDRITISNTNKGNVVRLNGVKIETFQDGATADAYVARKFPKAEVVWL